LNNRADSGEKYSYSHDIAVPGDGIGPEVGSAAVHVLKHAIGTTVAIRFNSFKAVAGRYVKTGDAFPDESLQSCKSARAVLHGEAALPQ